jgi:hypothetical protein
MRNRSRVHALVLAGALLPLLGGSAEAKVYKVYFLGGQSNMDGFGYVKELPPDLRGPVKGARIFHGNTAADGEAVDGRGVWAELHPGHGTGFASDGRVNRYSDRFGVELSFARRLLKADPSANIAIIKYARGGTSIDAAAAGPFGCWDPDFEAGNGVNQYDHFLATVRNAMTARDVDGDGAPDTLEPAGIVWMQGESDAAYAPEIAMRYRANLERLMNLIRAALWADDLPVAIGRISDSRQDADGKVWDYAEIVRQAQADYADADGHAALVSTDRYGFSDVAHYDSRGYLDLGEQFAEALIRLRARGAARAARPAGA